MATLVYTDAMLTVNGIDLSDHVKSLTLNYEAEMLDDTVMGTSGTRSSKPGLKNWSLEVEFTQDFDAGSVDETLFPLIGADSFPVTARAVKALAVSATNPQYSGNAVLENYSPIAGEVGTLGMTSCTFRAGGGAANVLVRSISGVFAFEMGEDGKRRDKDGRVVDAQGKPVDESKLPIDTPTPLPGVGAMPGSGTNLPGQKPPVVSVTPTPTPQPGA